MMISSHVSNVNCSDWNAATLVTLGAARFPVDVKDCSIFFYDCSNFI